MAVILGANILPAIISAVIAILIFFVSQWFLSRRSSVELKTKKLEELYLAVNQLSNQHAVRFEHVRAISNGDRSYLDNPDYIVKLYLHDINKNILLYVRLYFPKLSKTHQELFHENSKINQYIYTIIESGKISQEEFISTFVGLGSHIRAMEEEIIKNRRILVGENIIPLHYTRITATPEKFES